VTRPEVCGPDRGLHERRRGEKILDGFYPSLQVVEKFNLSIELQTKNIPDNRNTITRGRGWMRKHVSEGNFTFINI
jgi:hypothetical protein